LRTGKFWAEEFCRLIADRPDKGKLTQRTDADVIVSKSPEEFARFTKSETELYAKLIEEIGLVGE
jgi:hypothetical protein